jgi:glycosyltransferase involved in cell wall biosynthesis
MSPPQTVPLGSIAAYEIIIVDLFKNERGAEFKELIERNRAIHLEPKPNVWQSKYRLTSQNWFAAANARNTALCHAKNGHIAYCDDLAVLSPTWLESVRDAINGSYIAAGAYKKVRNLKVENGIAVSYDEHPEGRDCRERIVKEDVSPCDGGWLYGCSCVFPVDDLLQVGGWPEFCDSMGSEDYCLGIALRNAGKHLKYDRRMLTLESEELHFVEPPLKRSDKGVSPNDKSHAALAIAKGTKYFENYYEGGIRRMREEVLSGKPFPIVQIPDRDWFDGQLLSEM